MRPSIFLIVALVIALVIASPTAVLGAEIPFGSEQSISGGLNGANDIHAGDLDGDGVPDVVGIGNDQFGSGSVRYAENAGDGSAWTSSTLATSDLPRQIELADLDGDGDLDLVYTDWQDDRVYQRINNLNTSGTFGSRQDVGSPINGADAVMAGDLDGDLDLDLAVTGREADKYFWVENVDGLGTSWTTHLLAADLDGPQTVFVADLDGDDDLDVVGGGSQDDGKLVWHENTAGDASAWSTHEIAVGWFGGIMAGDVDHDGDPDIVVQRNDAGPDTADEFVWWENDLGNASSWTEHLIGPGGRDASKGLQLVDLDYDGDLDIVGSRNGDWYENTAGDASSWTLRNYDAADDNDIHDTDVADLDGDGDLDVVGARLQRDRLSWWPNLTCTLADPDDDGDGARDACDRCPGSDDSLDADRDGVPDGCDACPGGDDRVDVDGDGTPDACQLNEGSLAIDDVTASEGDSGTTDFTFTVTFTGGIVAGFTVGYDTQDGSATTADGDFAAASGTLSFAGTDGETKAITVSVEGDAVLEGDEGFTVELGTPSKMQVTVTDGSGLGTIQNDDVASLAIADATASEGDAGTTDLAFSVTLTGDVESGFTVGFVSADGTATVADGDYSAAGDSLAFAGTDGETAMLTVTVQGDAKVETDEVLTVVLGSPSYAGVAVADGSGTGTVENDDTASIAIGDVGVAEGDAGTTDLSFTVALSGEVQDGFVVSASPLDGSAVAPGDYADTAETLAFDGALNESEIFTVSVSGDTVVEGDETLFVLLGTPSSAAVSVTDASGLGTIQNDDSATVAIDDVSLAEGDAGTTDFTFTTTLSGDVADGFSVGWGTADSTASVAAGDYATGGGSLVFDGTDGETETATVSVSGDAVVEGDETFFVLLAPPSVAGVSSSDGSGLGTIQNDDTATIAIADLAAAEGDDGSTAFELVATLTGAVESGVSVAYATQDGTATAGSDYDAGVGVLSFDGTDGETESVAVLVHGDTEVEGDETFLVNLSSSSNGDVSFTDATGQGLISDDDVLLTVLVEGLGNVSSSPAGIDCGDDGQGGGGTDCDKVFPITSVVDLTPTPAAEWSFGGWSGDADCADGSVTLNVETSCTATFDGPMGELTVDFQENGFAIVTSSPEGIDCDREDVAFGGPRTDCSAFLATGVDIELDLVVTSPDTTFDGWTGDADCADGTISFSGDGETKTCVAILPVTPFFTDGFESGDTSAWSVIVP